MLVHEGWQLQYRLKNKSLCPVTTLEPRGYEKVLVLDKPTHTYTVAHTKI